MHDCECMYAWYVIKQQSWIYLEMKYKKIIYIATMPDNFFRQISSLDHI